MVVIEYSGTDTNNNVYIRQYTFPVNLHKDYEPWPSRGQLCFRVVSLDSQGTRTADTNCESVPVVGLTAFIYSREHRTAEIGYTAMQ